MWDDRRLKSGYSNLGSIQIPPVPGKIVLTDRTTGLLKQLTYDTGTLALTLSLPSLTTESATIYSSTTGPRFPENTKYILILTNGVLSALLTTPPDYIKEHNTAPIYARSGLQSRKVLLSEFV